MGGFIHTIINYFFAQLRNSYEILSEKYGHLFNDPEYFPRSAPAPDTVFLEGIGEDIDFAPAHSDGLPAPSKTRITVTQDHVHLEEGHAHEPPTVKTPIPFAAIGAEDGGWEGSSPEQRDQAKAFFDLYGTEEGLRRFREMDPGAARQFERERREPPVHSEPDDKSSTQ